MSSSANWEAVIGLEVHVQLHTQTKMFCSCINQYGGAANSQVCPVCLGMPGSLPVPNEEAIRKTILTGLMFDVGLRPWLGLIEKTIFIPTCRKIIRSASLRIRSVRGHGRAGPVSVSQRSSGYGRGQGEEIHSTHANSSGGGCGQILSL